MEHCAEQDGIYLAVLPDAARLDKLSLAEKAMFERLAARLKANAESLRAAAARRDRARVRETFARLTSTCDTCYAALRESGGAEHNGGP